MMLLRVYISRDEKRRCHSASEFRALVDGRLAEKAIQRGLLAPDAKHWGQWVAVETKKQGSGYEVTGRPGAKWNDEELRRGTPPNDFPQTAPYLVAVRRSTFTDLTQKQASRLEGELAKLSRMTRRALHSQDHLEGAHALFAIPSCMRPPHIESSKEEPIWRMIDEAHRREIPLLVIHADGRIVKSWRDAHGRERFWMER